MSDTSIARPIRVQWKLIFNTSYNIPLPTFEDGSLLGVALLCVEKAECSFIGFCAACRNDCGFSELLKRSTRSFLKCSENSVCNIPSVVLSSFNLTFLLVYSVRLL